MGSKILKVTIGIWLGIVISWIVVLICGIVLMFKSDNMDNIHNRYVVDTMQIDNHEYIIVSSKSVRGKRTTGISIIHAENCKCKTNK